MSLIWQTSNIVKIILFQDWNDRNVMAYTPRDHLQACRNSREMLSSWFSHAQKVLHSVVMLYAVSSPDQPSNLQSYRKYTRKIRLDESYLKLVLNLKSKNWFIDIEDQKAKHNKFNWTIGHRLTFFNFHCVHQTTLRWNTYTCYTYKHIFVSILNRSIKII